MAVVIIREEEIEKWFRFITHQFAVIRRDLREVKTQMALIDDKIAALQNDVQNIKALVDDLRAQIEAGASQETLDKLDAIDQALDAIAPDSAPTP